MTFVEQSRKAPTVVGRLPDKAQVNAKTLSVERLISPERLKKPFEELSKKFGLDKTSLLHKHVSEFFDFIWDRYDSVDDFVIGFHSPLHKISSLRLHEKSKGHILLRQANLNPHDRNIVVGSAGGNYSLQAVTTALRNAYRTEGLPATSMASSSVRAPRRNGVRRERRWGFGRSSPSSNYQDYQDEPPLFYGFVSEQGSNEQPGAILDSGACASVAGKATLDAAMRSLGIPELKDELVGQQEHRFGTFDKAQKTLCAVRVPFTCSAQDGSQVQFHIRFDVIDGTLPFLVGLLSRKAMAAMLSFKHSNLSLVINRVLHKIQLIHNKSHLYLPLRCKSTHSRPLTDRSNITAPPSRDVATHGPGAGLHYYTPSAPLAADNKQAEAEETRHLTSASEDNQHITINPTIPDETKAGPSERILRKNDFFKLHKQLGHGSHTQVRKFVRDAGSWKRGYNNTLHKAIQSGTQNLAAVPKPRSVCFLTPLTLEPQNAVSINVVFFNGKPFFHCIDSCTRWSETGPLRARRLIDRVSVFNRIRINRHGNPVTIRADQE